MGKRSDKMTAETFGRIVGSLEELRAFAKGKLELRTTVFPDAPVPMSASNVRALRDQLNASQAVFARSLNVSTKLVQAWEANRRQPTGPALRLLELGRESPELVFAGVGTSVKRRDELPSRRPIKPLKPLERSPTRRKKSPR